MRDGRFREYSDSDTKSNYLADIGTYQKSGGSITMLSDRPGAKVESLFGIGYEGVMYWVGSENIYRIAKPEYAALRQTALRETD